MSGHLRVVEICERKLFPTTGVRKAVEAEQRRAVHNDVTDLNYAPQTDQLSLVDLIASQQFGVMAKVAQKPGQLPERLRGDRVRWK